MWKLALLWRKFRNELAMVWLMLRNPRAPLAAKAVAVLAVLYVISPIDFVPDAIPLLGWLDDGVIALLLMQLALRFLPAELHASLKAQVDSRQAKRGSALR